MHDDSISLSELWDVIKKKRKIIWGCFCTAIVIALLVNLLMPRQYESTINLRVKYPRGMNETIRLLPSQELMRQEINTYAEIIKSRTVIAALTDRLYPNKEDQPEYEDMLKLINTQLVRNSEILSISTFARSPEEAQAAANILLEIFNERLIDIVRAEARETRTFIGERLTEAKSNLDKTEKEMVKYKTSKQTVSVSDQTKNLIERQAELKKMRIENQVFVETARARLSNVNRQLSQINPGFIGDNPLIQQYKSRLADQETELVGLKKNYTENHPKVRSLQATIDETRGKLNAEIKRVVNVEAPSSSPVHQGLLQNKIQTAVDIAVGQAQRSALDRVNADFDKEITLLPEKEQGLARLMRDYSVAEETYTMLAKRYEQARIDEVREPTNVQVIDRASLPDKPVRPRKLLNLIIAAVLGLFVGVTVAFVSEYGYRTIDTIEDVNKYLDTEVVGCIPGYLLNDKKQNTSVKSNVTTARESRRG